MCEADFVQIATLNNLLVSLFNRISPNVPEPMRWDGAQSIGVIAKRTAFISGIYLNL